MAVGPRCPSRASWALHGGGLTALPRCPCPRVSAPGHATPHQNVPGPLTDTPSAVTRGPGTPVSGWILAFWRTVVNFPILTQVVSTVPVATLRATTSRHRVTPFWQQVIQVLPRGA